MLRAVSALGSHQRMRIVAELHRGGRAYVSDLARTLGISRPLLHLHLRRLLEAGLVTSRMEVSPDGKALNYFENAPFALTLTPASIAQAALSLSDEAPPVKPTRSN
nr:winged helix-turn-helix domain-containing protein [Bordetella sp. BOR01]